MSTLVPKGIKIFFPNYPIFIKPKGNFLTSKGSLRHISRPHPLEGVVTFVVPVNMTKFEVKKLLEGMYNLGVIKVNTQIYQGKMKRDLKGRWFRQKAYKKAIVTIDNTAYLDQLQTITAPSTSLTVTPTRKDE